MPTISLVASKGGVGKSTITSNLGVALHQLGQRVVLVDADDQQTLLQWAAVAAEMEHSVPMVVGAGDDVRRVTTELNSSYDWVLVDTPGRHGRRLLGALGASDLALIPVRPSAADAWALAPVLEALGQVREVREGLPRAFLLMNAWQRTRMAESAEQALGSVGDLDVLGVSLGNRTAYAEALAAGSGVVANEPGGTASREVRELVEAVLTVFGVEREQEEGTRDSNSDPQAGSRARPA